MDLNTAVERYMGQESLNNLEGQRGVRNLAKLVNALGYQDPGRYGQQAGGYSLGDIFAFLEDNPGALEAVVDWVKSRRHIPEWTESLNKLLAPVDDEDEDLDDDGDVLDDPNYTGSRHHY
jgi:hypothetical protein